MKLLLGLFLFSLCFVQSGCQFRPKPPKALAISGNVIGEFGNQQVTDLELLALIERLEKKFPRKFSTHPQKHELLDQYININLLYQEALRQGLDKDFEFKSKLADVYVQQIAERARAQLSEKDLNQYYLEHREELDQISARHILLRFKRATNSKEKSELKRSLESIRSELLLHPETFPEVAKQKSQDSSASAGGELGYFNFNSMVRPFAETAFQLKKVGEISKVVESDFGFHLIQLTGDKRGMSFVKELVADRLLRTSQRAVFDKEVARLRSKNPVVLYDESLRLLSPLIAPGAGNTKPDEVPTKK